MLQFEIYFCHNILEWKLDNKMKPINLEYSQTLQCQFHQIYELVLYFTNEWDKFVDGELNWLVAQGFNIKFWISKNEKD